LVQSNVSADQFEHLVKVRLLRSKHLAFSGYCNHPVELLRLSALADLATGEPVTTTNHKGLLWRQRVVGLEMLHHLLVWKIHGQGVDDGLVACDQRHICLV